MADALNTFLSNLKSAIEADQALSAYVEAVGIVSPEALRDDSRLAQELPDFDTHGVVIAVRSVHPQSVACGAKQDLVEVDVVALAKALGNQYALRGSGQGGETVGIIKMRQDLFDLVDRNTFGDSIDLVESENVNSRGPIELVADGYYYQAVIPMKAWLPEYISET